MEARAFLGIRSWSLRGVVWAAVAVACAHRAGPPPPPPTAAESRAALAEFFGAEVSVEDCRLSPPEVLPSEDHQHFRTWVAVQPFDARVRYRAPVSVPGIAESRAAMSRPGWTIAQGARDGLLRALLGVGAHAPGSESATEGAMLLERVDRSWRVRVVDRRIDPPEGANR